MQLAQPEARKQIGTPSRSLAFELFCFGVAFALHFVFQSFSQSHVIVGGVQWPILSMTLAAFGLPIVATCLRLPGAAARWRQAGGLAALLLDAGWFSCAGAAGRMSFGADVFHTGVAVLAAGLIVSGVFTKRH